MSMKSRILNIILLFGISVILLLNDCALTYSQVENHKSLKGKSIALIIASNKFQYDELFIPLTYFNKHGASVIVASSTLKLVKGMNKKSIAPNSLYKDLNPTDYDAIIFIGGSGASEYFDDPIAHSLAKETVKLSKVLGAICIAPIILANAGILETKRATVWPGMSDELAKKCNIYTGKDVEVDGNIITANGPASAQKFAEEM